MRETEPRPALGRLCRARGAALQPRGCERVDARAERHQQGRKHHQRDGSVAQRDERAARAHRVEEAQREHEQARERAGHGERAVQHGAPGRLQRAHDRRASVGAAGELLAISRQHEQAVVDAQAETHPRDEVDREDREAEELVDHPQQQERRNNREAADEQRQHRRDEPAKDPEGEQQQDREGECLGAFQPGDDLLVDFVERDVVAAEAHAAAGQLRA